MARLVIGTTGLDVSLPADELVREMESHLLRVIGSRGDGVDWIERRWGQITIAATPTDDEVTVVNRGRDGTVGPITEASLPPGGSDEIALGYVVGRLLCRGFVTAAAVQAATPLPNGRLLTELRGIEIASMPQALHDALEELHVIGFSGMPIDPPGALLWIEGGPVLPTHDPSAHELCGEIDELRRRMAEKFRISKRGAERFGDATLEVDVVPLESVRFAPPTTGWAPPESPPGAAPRATPIGPQYVTEAPPEVVRLSSRSWARGHPDLPLLQWVLIHLMRPRRRYPFFPMRHLLIVPRMIPSASVLPSGIHLADLSAIRHQLMPAKIAQILGDLHRRAGDPRTLLSRIETGPSERTVDLRFGPIRFPTTRTDRDELLTEAVAAIAPLAELFASEGGGAEKYGPVTLQVVPRGDRSIEFTSAEFLPGCPDEILSEFLVASWLQNGTIPLAGVHHARRIGRRTVVAAPTIQRQLAPAGTIDLIESIHSGRTGPDRRASGWKHLAE
ncbi:MAG: hypothetical protein H6682_07330 [Candidatus Eisenbacteria bacterium]|nr:hypothetical protein [Candidatus Eisenbacteria bacterium]